MLSYNDDKFTYIVTDITEFLEQAKQPNEAGTVKVKKVRKHVEKSIDGLPEQNDGVKSEKKVKKVKKKVTATATKTVVNGVESVTEQKAVAENLEISSSQKTVSYRDLAAIYAV